MFPIIKTKINKGSSILDLSVKTKLIEDKINVILKNPAFKSLIDSPIPLSIDIVINPTKAEIGDSYSPNKVLYIKVDAKLDGDHDIYSLMTKLGQISTPSDYPTCLIQLGIISEKEEAKSDNEESRPRYIAVDPKWKMEEIVLSDEILTRLQRAVSVIKNRSIILNDFEYTRVDKSLKSILCLYGPPGTGKTITAQGLATLLGKKIIMSSYAQIESKYVGDGAKNLRALFNAAEEQDAVLFMDEADSFLSKRIGSTSSSSDKHYNRMSNELFQLLEEYNGCVIFATNLLTDLDEAFKSRIVDSIFFPLPDQEGRITILRKMVPSSILDSVFDTNHSIESLSLEIDGFSGRDIRKSLLLSYADAAQLKANNPDSFKWNYDLFVKGFYDVKSSFSEGTSDIPVEEVQRFEDELRFKQMQLEIAKHAALVDDSILDDRELELLDELSNSLINRPIDKDNLTPEKSLVEICASASSDKDKYVLLDTAIRVMAINGSYSENEKVFLQKVAQLLGCETLYGAFNDYAESVAASSRKWIDAISK